MDKKEFNKPMLQIINFYNDEIICTSGDPDQFMANGTYADDGKWHI